MGVACPLCNSQSLESQSGLYSAIRNRIQNPTYDIPIQTNSYNHAVFLWLLMFVYVAIYHAMRSIKLTACYVYLVVGVVGVELAVWVEVDMVSEVPFSRRPEVPRCHETTSLQVAL